MKRLMEQRLLLALTLSALSGCSSTPVHNQCPAPVFPRCTTIKHIAKDEGATGDMVATENVMLKLRELQDADQRSSFGKCIVVETGSD